MPSVIAAFSQHAVTKVALIWHRANARRHGELSGLYGGRVVVVRTQSPHLLAGLRTRDLCGVILRCARTFVIVGEATHVVGARRKPCSNMNTHELRTQDGVATYVFDDDHSMLGAVCACSQHGRIMIATQVVTASLQHLLGTASLTQHDHSMVLCGCVAQSMVTACDMVAALSQHIVGVTSRVQRSTVAT